MHGFCLFRLPHLDLQHPHHWIRLQQFQNRGKVVIRQDRVFGPDLPIARLSIPVNSKLLDRFVGVGGLVLGHDYRYAISVFEP
jgi:hypothetical protein